MEFKDAVAKRHLVRHFKLDAISEETLPQVNGPPRRTIG